jgi:DNA-binding MarR family transcriptional regulator
MSSDALTKQRLALLKHELQRCSDDAVLLNQAIAERCGIHPTDLKVLSLLSRHGALSPGRIAELTGLTAGAVTFMLDRLEQAGFARRVRHPTDRRSVLIELNREATEGEISKHFARLDQALEQVFADYSEAELAIFLDFMRRNNEVTEQVITQLREEP